MINNRDKIDELFRNGLDGSRVEPSQDLWKKIEGRFFTAGGFWRKTALILVLLLAVTGVGITTWMILPEGRTGSKADVNKHPITVNETQQPTEPWTREGSVHAKDNKDNTESSRSAMPEMDPGNELPKIVAKDEEAGSVETLPVQVVTAGTFPLIDEKRPSSTVAAYPAYDLLFNMTSLAAGKIPVKPSSLSMMDMGLNPPEPIYPGLENIYVRRSSLAIGAHITPSVIFYDPNPNKNGLQGGLSLNYYHSSFSLHTGIGISVMEDIGYYDIHYMTYDSVGYFMNITGFTVDPTNPYEVDFIFKHETVYDSVPHVSVTERTNRYTYLDVPLAVGFRFYEKKRLSMTAKAGMKVSFLVGRHEPTVDFSITGAEMITVDRRVPTRMKTTWRITAALDFGLQLSNRLSLHLEPVYEQYLRSVYANQPGFQPKKPFQVGLRTGLIYEF